MPNCELYVKRLALKTRCLFFAVNKLSVLNLNKFAEQAKALEIAELQTCHFSLPEEMQCRDASIARLYIFFSRLSEIKPKSLQCKCVAYSLTS